MSIFANIRRVLISTNCVFIALKQYLKLSKNCVVDGPLHHKYEISSLFMSLFFNQLRILHHKTYTCMKNSLFIKNSKFDDYKLRIIHVRVA
jgi:hypothetical protein